MDDLSLHILDVVENSITAGATLVDIRIMEQSSQNSLSIEIADNGQGMNEIMVLTVLDPFMTTKKKAKSIGLGLPLLADAARAANGDLRIESKPGVGTRILATMEYHHIDRKPLGDLTGTMLTLIVGYPQVDFCYTHVKNDREFILYTWEFKKEMHEKTLSSAHAIRRLREALARGEANLQ